MGNSLERYTQYALEGLQQFYKDYDNVIDLSQITVQIEEFTWKNAIYRMDLVVNIHPKFIPWPSTFVMAHRMWMAENGEIVYSEPIYDQPNHPPHQTISDLPKYRQGFYPGNSHFQTQLNFIDQALKTAETLRFPESGNHYYDRADISIATDLTDLADHRGEVTEDETHFKIKMSPRKFIPGDKNFDHYTHVNFSIDKLTAQISDVRLEIQMPPALC